MKSKTNKIVFLITVVVFIGIVFYFFNHMNNKRSTSMLTTIAPALLPVKEALLEMQEDKKFNQLSKAEQLEKTKAILNKIPDTHQQLKQKYKMAISPLPEITFYGRVIDQYGQPVKNASVWYSGENAYLSVGGGSGIVITDDEGYFMINTTGAALELGAIRHSEIDEVSYSSPKRSVNSSRNVLESTVRFLQHDKNRYALSWSDYVDKRKPYIINAWRLGKYEGAISGSVSAGVPANGKVYTLKLDEKERRERVIEGEKEGDFHISCNRPHIVSYKDYPDWNVSFNPVNGGIQVTNDLYMYYAPDAGYQSTLEINMRKGTKGYKHKLINQRYYFTSNTGRHYGSLFVHFEPFISIKEDVCRIRLSYRLNPTGLRNLNLKNEN